MHRPILGSRYRSRTCAFVLKLAVGSAGITCFSGSGLAQGLGESVIRAEIGAQIVDAIDPIDVEPIPVDPFPFLADAWQALWGVPYVVGQSHIELGEQIGPGLYAIIAWGNNPPEVQGIGLYMEILRGDGFDLDDGSEIIPVIGAIISDDAEVGMIGYELTIIDQNGEHADISLLVPIDDPAASIEDWTLQVVVIDDDCCEPRICPPGQTPRPNPGYTPTANGCTGVPDLIFKRCCDRHDICYGTCDPSCAARLNCDREFLTCMNQACRDTVPWWTPRLRAACYATALTYYGGVRLLGNSYFCDAQRDACVCR